MSVRINARLEGEVARKLDSLRQRSGRSTTAIIHAAIESYFEQVAGAARAQALLENFVGCASAEAELSEQHKSQLSESLTSKLSEGPGGKGPWRRGAS